MRYLVAPTRMHVWRLEEWHALLPEAELWGPPQIPNTFKRLPFAGILTGIRLYTDAPSRLIFRLGLALNARPSSTLAP